jgi:integrase
MKTPTIDELAPLTLPDIGNDQNALSTSLSYTYAHAATSANTRKAYREDALHFIMWGGVLPTTPAVLLRYLEAHAESLNPQTLKRRLTALKHWHVYQGLPDPTTHPLIRKTLAGITRIHGRPPEKAPALSIEQLALLVSHLAAKDRLVDWRNNALLQTGFFGAFRRSELVAIHWEQVTFVPKGMEILILRSKTDQEGEGKICAIPYGNKVLCPVTALQQWRDKSALLSGPIFRAISQKDKMASRALSPLSVSHIIKNLAIEYGFPNAAQYSGHSLRRGFATSASQKGATLGAIMRQGRWRNERTVNGYIEEGQRFEANAAGLLLETMPPQLSPDISAPEE